MIRDFNPLKPFRFWSQKILPLVYDDSLSYYEVLCKLTAFVNELAGRISDAFEEISLKVQEYVNQWLDEHPEATTTVQDYSLTPVKMNQTFWDYLNERYRQVATEFEVLFPKMTYAGLCSVFKDDNTVIMVDTGATESYSDLVTQLALMRVSHIDCLIITHYHKDHIGNVVALCNAGYIDSNTEVYYPVSPVWSELLDNDNYYQQIIDRIFIVNTTLVNKGAVMHEVTLEDTVAVIGNFRMKFNNCALPTYMPYYQDTVNNGDMSDFEHANYNNFSMIATIANGDTYIMCAGDIEYLAQETVAQYIDRNFDIMVLAHHDSDVRASEKFNTKVHAKYAVQCGSQVSAPKANGNMILAGGSIYSLENDADSYRVFNVKNGMITSNIFNYNYAQNAYNLPSIPIVPKDDLNDFTRPGCYYSIANSEGLITNAPPVNKTFRLEVKQINRADGNRCQQDIYTRDGVHFMRYRTSIGGAIGWVGWRLISDGVRSVSAGNRIELEVTGKRSGNLYAYGDNERIFLSFRDLRFDANIATNVQFATLPEQLRPAQSRYIPFSLGSVHGTVYVGTNGAVYFGHLSETVTPSNYFYLDLEYYTGMTNYTNVD